MVDIHVELQELPQLRNWDVHSLEHQPILQFLHRDKSVRSNGVYLSKYIFLRFALPQLSLKHLIDLILQYLLRFKLQLLRVLTNHLVYLAQV